MNNQNDKAVDSIIQPGERITVQKLDTQGHYVVSYEATVVELLSNGLCLAARWTRPTLALGYTSFETGDHFTEWFFTDHWYNIFEIASADGQCKGWYCNIAEPAQLQGATLSSRDLLLDFWVDNELGITVLDEDEFAADPFLTAETRVAALHACDELRERIRQRQPPFDS